MPDPTLAQPAAAADYWNDVLPDGGPRYVETDLARIIVEPCNAITAALFIALVLYWLWKMRGRYREHPFTLLCLPVLLTGGVGGTIFHALRMHRAFFLMDVIPIGLLVIMGSIYLWIRLRPRLWHALIIIVLVLALPTLFVVDRFAHHVAIVLHYCVLALLILIPVGITLARTRGRHANLIKLTVVLFGLAVICRYIDPVSAPVLPGLGTHWLWHTFGMLTTGTLAEYFYRLETEPIAPLPAGVAAPAAA